MSQLFQNTGLCVHHSKSKYIEFLNDNNTHFNRELNTMINKKIYEKSSDETLIGITLYQ